MSQPYNQKLCCKTIKAAVQNWAACNPVDRAVKQSLSYPDDCEKADTCRANGGKDCTCIAQAKASGHGLPCGCDAGPAGIMEAAIPVAKKKTTVVIVKDKKKKDESKSKS